MIDEWTTELRYRPYRDWPAKYLVNLCNQVQASPWRLHYHIQPTTGLLNDPNGFSFFNGRWQLFYQAYPFGPVHGLKSWVRMSSTDLIHWHNDGEALIPDTPYDAQGVFSGSALPMDDKLFLMYTGNVRDHEWHRHSYQVGAWLDTAGKVTKLPEPLISTPPTGFTNEFRDPQITRTTEGGYRVLIGGQSDQEQGFPLIYEGPSIDTLRFKGILHTGRDAGYGFMVECPNLVSVDGHQAFIFCPQGLNQGIAAYQNIFPNMVITADDVNWDTRTLINPTAPVNLDEGFDVYASQAFVAPDGRALLNSWIGMPGVDAPDTQDSWANCLSLVKELHYRDGQLYQYPVAETKSLRGEARPLTLTADDETFIGTGDHYELALHSDSQAPVTLTIAGVKITIDQTSGTVIVDRSHAGVPFAEKYGTTRRFSLPAGQPVLLNAFVDTSVMELYFNHGQKVCTVRFFPKTPADLLRIETSAPNAVHATLYPLTALNINNN